MTRDRMTGITVMLLGIAVCIYTNTIPNPAGAGDSVGPRAFPYITAGLLLLCGAGLALQKSEHQKPFLLPHQWKRMAAICGVYFGYVMLLWAFGFILATPVCLLTLATMFSAGKKVPLWSRLLFAVGVTAVLYFLFFTMLGMSLPVGKIVRLII